MYLLLAINEIKSVKVKALGTMWKLRMKTFTFCIHMLIISQYRMVDRCYIIFIGSQSDLSSAMASRWRMEAVQQRTSLLVHMSHRNGPNTQLCRICREKYLQCMKNILLQQHASVERSHCVHSTAKASVFPFESV